jgi:hypothetical protein
LVSACVGDLRKVLLEINSTLLATRSCLHESSAISGDRAVYKESDLAYDIFCAIRLHQALISMVK